VVQDSGDFSKQCSDVLGALRDINVQQLLDGQREALLVCHHGDIIETVKVWQGLHIGLVFDQLLGTAVQQTDVGI
jgi:hemin uptake protein HemP